MGNAKGLQGPDGRPARQFGEDILEPGEPFTCDTMDVIRSLVDDREVDVPCDDMHVEPPATKKLHVEQAQSIQAKNPEIQMAAPQLDSIPLSDIVQDDFREFSKLAESYAAAMGLEDKFESDLKSSSVDADSYVESGIAHETHVETIASLNSALPERPVSEERLVDEMPETDLESDLPENIAQVMSDMDRFAGAKIAEIEANEAEKESNTDPSGWSSVAVDPVPPLKVKRKWIERPQVRSKPEWRKLNVVEGAPGRAVRNFLSQPRNIALLMLVYISLWRPWFIPTLTFVIFLSVVLIAISIGPDRVASFTGWWFARLKRRNPQRADRLIRRGNRILRRVEGLANLLPPAWVAGFYLPELDGEDRTAENDAQLKSRLERIAAQEQVGAT